MPKTTKKVRPPKAVSGQTGYCRVCQKPRPLSEFYEATNLRLDKNGYMSICKDHCNELYNDYFIIHNNVETAIKQTCRDLDIRFSVAALTQTQSHLEKLNASGKSTEKTFGIYKSKLSSTGKQNEGMEMFRYVDSENIEKSFTPTVDKLRKPMDYSEIDADLLMFWGKGFDWEDYEFLENELATWKQTHKCDNQAETTLLKEICIKILSIRNKRAKNDSVSNDLKELQDLMKTASVDPAKANVASAGKSLDCFGIWVKDIEQFRPAEWHDKQEKYKDMDGFIPYIYNYIVRPIKNFLTGNRDFKVNDNIATLDEVNIDNGGE